jgi:hypothetical protein
LLPGSSLLLRARCLPTSLLGSLLRLLRSTLLCLLVLLDALFLLPLGLALLLNTLLLLWLLLVQAFVLAGLLDALLRRLLRALGLLLDRLLLPTLLNPLLRFLSLLLGLFGALLLTRLTALLLGCTFFLPALLLLFVALPIVLRICL